LSFEPRLGLGQFAKRAREPARGVALRTRRHRTRLAHVLERGMPVGKGTAEEQEIAHGPTPVETRRPSWPGGPERRLKALFGCGSPAASRALPWNPVFVGTFVSAFAIGATVSEAVFILTGDPERAATSNGPRPR
jgi:hypothetical protein